MEKRKRLLGGVRRQAQMNIEPIKEKKMVTFDDVTKALVAIDREDAVACLGQLYEDNHDELRAEVDTGEKYHRLSDAINSSMTWRDTPQGHKFWEIVTVQLNKYEGAGVQW